MAGSGQEFRIKTFIFIAIIFTIMTIGHSIALMAKGDTMHIISSDIPEPTEPYIYDPDQLNKTSYVLSPLEMAGAVLFGLELPMPFPIIITLFNAVCVAVMAFIIYKEIQSWVPFINNN